MRVTFRAYGGPADLALMQRVVSESWLRAAPIVSCTVADLEWWQVNDPEPPLEGNAWIWELDGRPVGWEWLDPPFSGDWHLSPGLDPAPFLEPFLDRIEERARGATAPAAGEAPSATRAWALDTDRAAIDVLERRGYHPDGLAVSHWIRTMPAGGGPPLAEPTLPPGYRHDAMSWPDNLARRTDLHRAAFVPSSMTIEKFATLPGQPHYAPERDRLVVARDGTFAAFATAWWDPIARVGELEPVGTHPDHRRLGLARAACLRALADLDRLGARFVVINTGVSNDAAGALYEGLGCERLATRLRYARPLRPPLQSGR